MIEVICINDKFRPREIPDSDWVKEGESYHITHVSIQVNQLEGGQPVLGCDLYEKPLSMEKHAPYECWRLARFGVTKENLEALKQLIEDCFNLPKQQVADMIKESQLVEID